MVQRGDFLISGIVAAQAGAGFVSIPANFRAGGGLRVMMHQVMFQCGDFLISGIVAAQAGTGFVGVPALFRAGGGLRVMTHQIMVQRGDFLISGIVAAQAGTGFVGVPALFCAGGGLRYVTHQIMVQCGQLFAGGIAAADAAVVSVPADFRTSGGFCCVLHQVVTAVVTPSASFARSLRGAGRAAVAAAGCVLFFCVTVGVRAYAGVRAVAVRRPRAPCVTGDVVFRAAFFTGFACGAGGSFGTAGMYL